MKIIQKYINQYYIAVATEINGKPTKNPNDNYLIGKGKSETYRHSDDKIAIYFPSGVSTSNVVIPKLESINVHMTLHIDCDEQVYLFNESDLHKVHSIVKFQIKGKNNQIINDKGFVVDKKK